MITRLCWFVIDYIITPWICVAILCGALLPGLYGR